MFGFRIPALMFGLLTAAAVPHTANADNLPADADRLFAEQADWVSAGEASDTIQQVQFGGFRPRLFRPPLAAATPSRPTTTPQRTPRRLLASAPTTPRRRRLARAPDMLGDSFLPSAGLVLMPQLPLNGLTADTPIPVAGGSARLKIGEHNKPLPVDRVYVNYNHFHNAVQRQALNDFGDTVQQSTHLDRFTIGAERTLLNGDASVELRLPLSQFPDQNVNLPLIGPAGRFQTDTGVVGNLSLIGKRLLVNSEDLIVSAGLGVEFPTGADGSAMTGDTLFNIENEALYLQPFVAATLDNGTTFVHAFLQIDVDLKGSPLQISGPLLPGRPVGVGEVTGPTLIHWDTSAGIRLINSDDTSGLTGLALISEFHLTSALSAADQLQGVIPSQGGPVDFMLSSAPGRFTATYITTGIHTEFGQNRVVRVAAVFPLRDGINQFFDAELQVQFGGRYWSVQ